MVGMVPSNHVYVGHLVPTQLRLDSQNVPPTNDRIEVRKLRRPCTAPGCPMLTYGGPCEQHRRARQREHDVRRGTSAERGYDASFRRLRVLCFQRDEWRCVDCGWQPKTVRIFREAELGEPPVQEVLKELRQAFGRRERHLHADHQIPIADRPDLRLDLDNLRTRCDACHRAKTMRESVRKGPVGPVKEVGPIGDDHSGGHL
jgi:5-methylcytosine-specific restriction endonuclease McrA